MREKQRGGQSFVVVPRIEDTAIMAERLRRHVPELTLCEAHGKMPLIHHLQRPLRFLRQAIAVLKPGGRLVLCEPAMSLWSNWCFAIFTTKLFDLHWPLFDLDGRPPIPTPIHAFTNQAIPEILFWKERERTLAELGACELVDGPKIWVSALSAKRRIQCARLFAMPRTARADEGRGLGHAAVFAMAERHAHADSVGKNPLNMDRRPGPMR